MSAKQLIVLGVITNQPPLGDRLADFDEHTAAPIDLLSTRALTAGRCISPFESHSGEFWRYGAAAGWRPLTE